MSDQLTRRSFGLSIGQMGLSGLLWRLTTAGDGPGLVSSSVATKRRGIVAVTRGGVDLQVPPTTPPPVPSVCEGAKYLLIDSRVLDRVENASLVLGKVKKESHNPLFVEDKVWEVRFDNLYANVLFDEEEQVYKVWYNLFIIDEATSTTPIAKRQGARYIPGKREMGLCYATSKDGIIWEKPALGIIEFNGSKENNLVMRHVHGVGVRKDQHEVNPEQRYKAFMAGGMATSPDGFHWSDVLMCPQIQAPGGTHNNFFWDDRLGIYVGITRLWEGRQRIVGRTATEILRALPEERDRQTYALLVFPHADLYLGLLMMLDTGEDTVDCELAWSPDACHWERVCPGTPLIPRGPKECWDCCCIYAAAYPLLREGELRLYYGGNNGPHGGWRAGGFGLARLRPDGFAGRKPTDANAVGTIITKPIECAGNQLRLSVDAAEGALRVAVLDADGLSLDDCEPIRENITDGIVTWRGGRNLAPLNDKPIRLLFELRSALLFAFSFVTSGEAKR